MAKTKYSPEQLMEMAIELSKDSIPEHINREDPYVGAILTTKDGEILATAFRGELSIGEHCEYTLLERKLKDKPLKDCVLYVTLEPCIDEVRTKPKRGCSSYIYKRRISTVYIGMRDPNIDVENLGVAYLKDKKIEIVDFPSHLESKIREINSKFIKEQEDNKMMLNKSEKVKKPSYLQEPLTTSTIADFDSETVHAFIKKSGAVFQFPSNDFNQWALNFQLVEKDKNNNLLPTKLGLILFGRDIQNILPHTIFKVEVDYGSEKTEIRDFDGPIVNQLPAILEFVKDKALKLTINRSMGERIIETDFPFEILREAIANAVIHRDYENESATNYLYISSKKIIIRSPGNPFYPLTIDDLRSFDTPSISRNPKIMYVFNRLQLAEQRGIGLRNMRLLSEKGFPLPVFNLKAGILELIFGRTKEFIADMAGVDSNKLRPQDKEGLLFIQNKNTVTVKEYAAEFDISVKIAQRRLAELISTGLVEMVGEKRWAKYKLKTNA